MIETKGKFLDETLDSLGLSGGDRSSTINNAKNIVSKIVDAYEKNVGKGHVGKRGKGVPKRLLKKKMGPTGLVYGRIQSGKTRAMIASTAMAFDNGFRIAVVMTSNINDLVSQTHRDFTDLKGVSVFTKDEELDKRLEDAKLDMERTDRCILLITSKGAKSFQNISNFLLKINAKLYPTLIIDDEGDQASLDTNNRKRSSTGNRTLKPSTINGLIGKLRKNLPASVYVSVTGTPQAVFLQSVSSNHRPSFVDLLLPGRGYIGGDHFFSTNEPENNRYKLISTVPAEDKVKLLNQKRPIPEGLKNSILFFLLSASAAVKNLEWPDRPNEKNKGYQYLCHPSLINDEQEQAESRISGFLTEIKSVLMGLPDNMKISDAMQAQYIELKKQLGSRKTPRLQELKKIVQQELLNRKILVINAENNKRNGIEYGSGFNFLIGGNTLGRGIAIPNLLVTYYVRNARTTQMDTVHQHARMFGYRKKTLPYTRLFITNDLYYRFRDIHYSDKGLREFIETHIMSFPDSFPVEISAGLNPTRKGVIDIDSTETILPGMQIYPNYMKIPQPSPVYRKIIKLVDTELAAGSVAQRKSKGKEGKVITVDRAIEIASLIKTKSKNSWNNKTIAGVIRKLSQRLGTDFILKYRESDRAIGENGFLAQGTISGAEQETGRKETRPTLWLMSVTGKPESKIGAGETFIFPTIIVPNSLPKAFVFSKK